MPYDSSPPARRHIWNLYHSEYHDFNNNITNMKIFFSFLTPCPAETNATRPKKSGQAAKKSILAPSRQERQELSVTFGRNQLATDFADYHRFSEEPRELRLAPKPALDLIGGRQERERKEAGGRQVANRQLGTGCRAKVRIVIPAQDCHPRNALGGGRKPGLPTADTLAPAAAGGHAEGRRGKPGTGNCEPTETRIHTDEHGFPPDNRELPTDDRLSTAKYANHAKKDNIRPTAASGRRYP